MAGEQRQHQRGLAVGVEVGPVQRHGDFGPAADDEGHPLGQQGVDIDPLVGQQAVNLLDGALGVQPARQRQALADQRDRQRGGLDRPQRGSGQGEDTLGMQAVVEQALQDAVDAVERNLLAGCQGTPLSVGTERSGIRLSPPWQQRVAALNVRAQKLSMRFFS